MAERLSVAVIEDLGLGHEGVEIKGREWVGGKR
jgi:hypothetical protein